MDLPEDLAAEGFRGEFLFELVQELVKVQSGMAQSFVPNLANLSKPSNMPVSLWEAAWMTSNFFKTS